MLVCRIFFARRPETEYRSTLSSPPTPPSAQSTRPEPSAPRLARTVPPPIAEHHSQRPDPPAPLASLSLTPPLPRCAARSSNILAPLDTKASSSLKLPKRSQGLATRQLSWWRFDHRFLPPISHEPVPPATPPTANNRRIAPHCLFHPIPTRPLTRDRACIGRA